MAPAPASAARMVREPADGKHRLLIIALSAGLAVTTAACGYLLLRDRDADAAAPRLGGKRRRRGEGAGEGAAAAAVAAASSSMPMEGSEVFPPLPQPVVDLLQSTRLCHLSTTSGDGVPHLSLMRFTYLREEEVIIMTTRTDTKKFELLQTSPQVAILVHDFPQVQDAESAAAAVSGSAPPPPAAPLDVTREGSAGGKGNTYSITLNGVARVQPAGGAEAERYRAVHLRNNEAYAQFIEGPRIAVLTVHVTSARICNIADRVTYWDAASAAREGSK